MARSDTNGRWQGARAAFRYFRIGRLVVLVMILIGVAGAAAALHCELFWLSVSGYLLGVAGVVYSIHPLLRLGLNAGTEPTEPLAMRVPGRPRVAKLNMSALSQRVKRRYDVFAVLVGAGMTVAGFTLSALVVPALDALAVLSCAP